jgi:hypothetical protein
MSFSSSFCLTNTGSLQLGTSVDIYSNIDNYTSPFQTDILLSNITGTNCPYVLNGIPNGTTTLQIKDRNSNCCVTISISPNTPCSFCNLGFDTYSSTTLSVIVAGNLTGSCDNNITDYLIYWYNITDLNTPVYTSGHGTLFQPYGFTHPLVGIGSIPALSGTYVPVIKKVRLNGVNYSSDFETGFVQASLNCFTNTTVSVSPLTCDNGTLQGNYTHLLQFSGASQGQSPVPVNATFLLSDTTNYFAWRFNGYSVPDTLKITYYGSYYNNQPIVLEYFNVGADNLSTNFSDTINPKLTKTYLYSQQPGFNKITCLTGLTRSVNDYLVLEITPNISNFKTDYDFYFTCLQNFNCQTCLDNYLNTPYKIQGSSITGITQSCGRIQLRFNVSGCSTSNLINSDYYKYYYTLGLVNPPYNQPPQSYSNGLIPVYNIFWFLGVSCSQVSFPFQTSCKPQSNDTITFKKDLSGTGGVGNVYMTFSNYNDLVDFYTTYNQRLTSAGVVSDPTNIGYYRLITLKVPILNINPSVALNESCGDTTTFIDYNFHTSSVATTGVTGNIWYMNVTMPTITKQINYTTCELYCDSYIQNMVNSVNNSSTGNSSNNISWVNNKGNRVNIPFYSYTVCNYNVNQNTNGTFDSAECISNFINKTLPMSGSNYTIIPSLTAQTCNLIGEYIPQNSNYGYNDDYYLKHQFYYEVQLTNISNVSDFKILAKNIVNGVPIGNPFRIWEIQSGSVIYSDPNFIY